MAQVLTIQEFFDEAKRQNLRDVQVCYKEGDGVTVFGYAKNNAVALQLRMIDAGEEMKRESLRLAYTLMEKLKLTGEELKTAEKMLDDIKEESKTQEHPDPGELEHSNLEEAVNLAKYLQTKGYYTSFCARHRNGNPHFYGSAEMAWCILPSLHESIPRQHSPENASNESPSDIVPGPYYLLTDEKTTAVDEATAKKWK